MQSSSSMGQGLSRTSDTLMCGFRGAALFLDVHNGRVGGRPARGQRPTGRRRNYRWHRRRASRLSRWCQLSGAEISKQQEMHTITFPFCHPFKSQRSNCRVSIMASQAQLGQKRIHFSGSYRQCEGKWQINMRVVRKKLP